MSNYKKRISDNVVIKFADNELPRNSELFVDVNSSEIEAYEVAILKDLLIKQRQNYLKETLDNLIASIEDGATYPLDNAIEAKRALARLEIDTINTKTTLIALEVYDNPF